MADAHTTAYRHLLMEEATRSLSVEDAARVEAAADFAIAAHGNQQRYSGIPYVTHVLETGRKLAAMRLPVDVVIAGVLHDSHEDAGISLEELTRRFNADVSALVGGVTKVGKVQYHGEARYVENLRKMFVTIAKDPRVIFIKFCDRLHNLEDLAVVPEPKRTRIAREALEIYAPIANRLGMGEVKGQLEDRAFPYAHPTDATWVDSLFSSEAQEAKRRACVELQTLVAQELTRHGVPLVAIHGRTKHRYSLYLKLIRSDRDLTKIFDLVALRIIVEDIADCYAVLGLLHQRWKPLKGRIKDYVANPKPNGYQSLHTTVFCDDGEIVEFQIRTRTMHEEAEWGAAAAWRYHERGGPKVPRRQLHWVDDLVRWQRGVQDTREFLDELRLEALKGRIYVYTPKGDVMELPEGATPIDFAYQVHTDVGNHVTGARVNGATTLHPLDHPLQNGDLVEVITDPKRRGPSPDWLPTVRTKLARQKIRDALRGSLRLKAVQWVTGVR